ncbi:MAG: hypothetical protein ISS10_03950 [Candidatus Marinimicrobia bacterium]|nr:hypothetical protein [Candidatus Neomarinimicrobiota bacterium]MBL7060135.1 hypothetical protein [Candidatus Neomarinimicrobiota bacterium]
MIKHITIILAFATSFGITQDLNAKTDDGKDVILHKNGTWEYAPKKIFDIPIDGSFTIGRNEAKVTIVEWTDFQ